MAVRHTLEFLGAVQGVGFRATCRTIAARHAVVGWVRNEPDGSVRCVIEGERAELERFVAAVRAVMSFNVREVRTAESAATGEFEAFRIERDGGAAAAR